MNINKEERNKKNNKWKGIMKKKKNAVKEHVKNIRGLKEKQQKENEMKRTWKKKKK